MYSLIDKESKTTSFEVYCNYLKKRCYQKIWRKNRPIGQLLIKKSCLTFFPEDIYKKPQIKIKIDSTMLLFKVKIPIYQTIIQICWKWIFATKKVAQKVANLKNHISSLQKSPNRRKVAQFGDSIKKLDVFKIRIFLIYEKIQIEHTN